ncbi:6-bladed beta-propeller [candidate division KSB1 bacterium]|nr:6-bladed beta-propeller [candidate division KSB1 bacterium]
MSMLKIVDKLAQPTWFCLLVVLWLTATGQSQQRELPDEVIVFPQPPDAARIQFLASISSSTDIVGQSSFFRRYVLGEEPAKPIIKPYGISIHKRKLYVCDTMLPGLEIIDFQAKTFRYFTPAGLGQLQKPINCALDESGQLYIADAGRQQVVVFDTEGNFLNALGFGHTSKPTDVKVHQNRLWICDLGVHQLRVVDLKTYKEVRSFPEPNPDNPAYLFSPTNIVVSNGKIYVSDTGNASIKVFSVDGDYMGMIGTLGNRPGQFVRPKGVAVDSDENLYVVDAAFENIQMFDGSSRLLMFFGGHSERPGYLWLPAAIAIDTENLGYFQKHVFSDFNLNYLIFVSNQFGPAKINVYGFIESKKRN